MEWTILLMNLFYFYLFYHNGYIIIGKKIYRKYVASILLVTHYIRHLNRKIIVPKKRFYI